MPQIVKKRRSGWAILAVGALVASLLAVGASPAAAIDDKSEPDAKATTSACVGAALADVGFTDLADAVAADINCLAYYGITTGRTADTFDPNSNVTREHMALFLYRTANVAGLDTMGGDGAADFGDIAELGEDRQNAINALARNGILAGRSDMAFAPHADITRAEMAVALVSLVALIPGAKTEKNDNGTITVDVGAGTVDVFTDAFGETPGPVNSAISAAYELGITTGTGDGTTFNPSGTVPRRNMASFITRALAHSNARPRGVTAQAVGDGITVSVRAADFSPVANAVIDAFSHDTEGAAKAFKDDGTCSSRFGEVVESGTAKCTIDPIDPPTGSQGNLNLSVTIAEKGTTVWVWTGDIGDKVNANTVLYELDLTPPDVTPQPAQRAEVSTDFNRHADFRAKFGSTVVFAIQLKTDVDHDGDDNTPTQELDARPDTAGDAYRVTITFPSGAASVSTITMDKDGSGAFDVSAGDPDPSSRGQSVAVAFSIAQVQSDEADDATNSPLLDDSDPVSADPRSPYTGTVTFSDAAPRPFAVKAEAVRPYSEAASTDNPTTGNRINVTVTDQYGDPIKDIAVTATSSDAATDTDPGSTFPTRARVTFPDGTVGIAYSYTGAAQSETVSVVADTGPGPDGVAGNGDDPEDLTETLMVHWTMDAAADGSGPLLAADVDNNLLILNVSDAPTVFAYDDNDSFSVGGSLVTRVAFEENLATVLESADLGDVAVTSYTAGDADDVGSFAWTQ